MKAITLAVLFLSLIFLVPFACGDNSLNPVPPATRILFIGNSLTYYNDLPGMLDRLVYLTDDRPQVFADRSVIGGASLKYIWSVGDAADKINKESWDYVVLQAGLYIESQFNDTMKVYIEKFDNLIKNKGAQTLIFQPWANAGYTDMQEELNDSLTATLEGLDLDIVPVGAAWEKVLAEQPEVDLHDPWGVHPTTSGTYLAACVFYSYLYQKSPDGLPTSFELNGNYITGCTGNEAELFHRAAWQVVQEIYY